MRLFYLHYCPPEELTLRLKDIHEMQIPVQANRGIIYDRNMKILASSIDCYTLLARPKKIANPPAAAKVISDVTGLDYAQVYADLTKESKCVTVARELDEERADTLRKLLPELTAGQTGTVKKQELDWFQLDLAKKRVYPLGKTAAQILGCVGADSKGLDGIEFKFNNELQGKDGLYVTGALNGVSRKPIESLRKESYIEPKDGNDLVLTIDQRIQSILEEQLEAAYITHQAERTSAMVMDALTGEVLAVSSYPTFDPNTYKDFPQQNRILRPVTDAFEPGSVFKVVTAIGAIEEGVVTEDEMINCEMGSYRFVRAKTTHDSHKLGVVPFRQVFAESSNIGTIKIAWRLGDMLFCDYVHRMGFGKRTGIEFPSETSGVARSPEDKLWSGTSMVTMPIGQGEVSVTLLQLAQAYSVVANNGIMRRPVLLKSVINKSTGTVVDNVAAALEQERQVCSTDTAERVRSLMCSVVDEGSGKQAQLAEFRVAGKTGTAQIADPATGRYGNRYNAVFIGIVPVSQPRLVIAVQVTAPKAGLYYGGIVSAPIFKEIALRSLRCMNVSPELIPSPEEEQKAQKKATPARRRPAKEEVTLLTRLNQPSTQVEMIGVDPESYVMPDLLGSSKKEVIEILTGLGVEFKTEGSGWVIAQEPAPGKKLDADVVCKIRFTALEP